MSSKLREETKPVIEPLLTPKDVAIYIGWSVGGFYNKISKGEGPKPCIEKGRFRRWRKSDIHAWRETNA